MQQDSAELPSTLPQASENAIKSTSTNAGELPRASHNPRFAITPETMGMNVRLESSATPTLFQSQHRKPVVEVKSYYERHSNHSVTLLTDCRQETAASAQANTPTHLQTGARPDRTDLMAQSLSPTTGSSQILHQQGHFQHRTRNESDTSAFQNSSSMPEAQTQCYDFCSNESAKLNFKSINGIYAKRIEDIDANACGDRDLKVFTYQEWVELLIKINEAFMNDMDELEREVAARLELMQKRVNSNCRHSQGNELMKCRKDIDTLLKYIRNSNSDRNRDCLQGLHGLTLETLTPDEVLDILEHNERDELKSHIDADADADAGTVQRNKLCADMKALAQEVAEKHDEVRELKCQVICLEDEIQKAQKKIQLKDDVIKELRNDLKSANSKITSYPPSEMSNYENQIPGSAKTPITDNTSAFQVENASQFESLSQSELQEQEKIKILQDEIRGLLEISDLNKQHCDQHHKRIKEVIADVVSEKQDACKKLNWICQQLIDLECESSEGKSDCDSGFRSNSEHDRNTKLIDAIRQGLRRRNDMICELRKKVQKLELEKKELSTKLETDKSFAVRSSDVLKEVADLLCDLRGKQFSYADLYNTSVGQMNPFCEAIMEMQNDFKEKEAQLLQDRENEELTQVLLQRKKDFNQEVALRSNLNDFEAAHHAPSQLLPTLAYTHTPTKPSQTPSAAHTNQTPYQ